jgi:hypothetical protein
VFTTTRNFEIRCEGDLPTSAISEFFTVLHLRTSSEYDAALPNEMKTFHNQITDRHKERKSADLKLTFNQVSGLHSPTKKISLHALVFRPVPGVIWGADSEKCIG